MASADANELFSAAVDFAMTMLRQHGEFIPFGVTMSHDGSSAMVGADLGTEHPRSQDVINLLQSSFLSSLRDGSIKAAAVCLDLLIVPPGTKERTDAVCVRLVHTSGEELEVFLPYVGTTYAGFTFGQVFAGAAGDFRLSQP